MRSILLTVVLATSSTALVAKDTADQFDLVCTGQHELRLIGQRGTPIPWTGRIKVDLSTATFCQDDCSKVETIGNIEPELLRLGDIRGSEYQDISQVDRSTGAYRRMVTKQSTVNGKYYGVAEDYQGICKPEKFTGFPEKLF